MSAKLLLVAGICLALCIVPTDAQVNSAYPGEVWDILAEAGLAIEQQRFEYALALYLQARRIQHPLPEAELGIARIYYSEGLTAAAERQYLRALNQSAYFQSEEFATEARYELARLYQQLERWSDYETILLEITSSESRFADPMWHNQRAAMRRLIATQGLDRVIVLYRLMEYRTLNAHAMVGIHFVRSGNYSPAVLHLLFASIKKIEHILDALRSQAPAYQFQTLNTLLLDMKKYPKIATRLQNETDIYELLYFLSAAILGDTPNSTTWQELWRVVANSGGDSTWGKRAQDRLQRPQLEPLIYSVR